MTQRHKEKLVGYINSKDWWRTSIPSSQVINDRGLFYASTYKEAEFYGKPLNSPFKVNIDCPLIGDNNSIEILLFGKIVSDDLISVENRFILDKKIKYAALSLGFDSIVLMSTSGYSKFIDSLRIPRSIELNVFNPIQD